MDNLFELRFSFEQKSKDEVIYKFSNKQGGNFNVFSFHWQCFVWAAIIGFLRNERRPLTPPIADKPFSLNTMMNNHGEKDAQALICLTIAKAGSLDIMKNPLEAINLINEYANGGFYHIMRLMENGENSFNDLEKVKQEIFSRNYHNDEELLRPQSKAGCTKSESTNKDEEQSSNTEGLTADDQSIVIDKKSRRWTYKEEKELIEYYKAGMSIEQLAQFFNKDEYSVKLKLLQKRIFV